MKNVYFISDAHLGSWAIQHRRMQERRLVRFLDLIKNRASAVYLLGDMFDFWHEYKFAVPKGYTRFLGKISELTDHGVEVHFFIGNLDLQFQFRNVDADDVAFFDQGDWSTYGCLR